MALTQKQENFCLEYIKCGNASEAYRTAYNTKPDTKDETIWNSAYKLLNDPDVKARVDDLKSKAESEAILSIEERKKILSDIARNVTYDKDGNASFTDARGAIDLLNKMDAVYVQKNQTELSGAVGVTFQIDLGDESN